ncbi:PAS domain S-box-containing protein [Loktanella fryxellensis]|uniref:histidine kinase n=1 Tax=Loktanella fryxellensis TaxID=245187 RepID=A0A1H8AR66_9RHOB|nr:PAS domain-containing protein [Loktanella fryxellensis]SEM73212.1 PAS domain S-box-containing protein [Loktanella fryxellensis]
MSLLADTAMAAASVTAQQVTILAPRGRDADVAREVLEVEGIDTRVVGSLAELAGTVIDSLGIVLATEEALMGDGRDALDAALAAQPAWSDVPFVVLSNGSVSGWSFTAGQGIERLNNAVLLSRPLHSQELLRAVRSALTARLRQHVARDQLEALHLRERQLRESEAKFHAIADSVDQMIWSTLPDGYHDYYNRRWYEFTGMPEGSTDGAAWNGMFHPDDQDQAWAVWTECLRTGDTYEIEYRLRHHTGVYRWVLGRAQPVRGEDGTIMRWYGTCTDIHHEVLARQATLTDITRQRDVVWDMAIDLIAVVNRDATLVNVNAAWTRILELTPAEVLGRSFLDWVHPDDVDRTVEKFISVFQSPLIDPYEFRFRHRDGSYRWFAWTASAHGGQVYAIGRDVTDRLERARTLAETEAALRQSQKLEMIGQLTGGVAHDFNNLLMATRASLDLLRRHLHDADDRSMALIANATKAVERGAALTQRMLAFARKQDLHAVAVDMATAIPDMRDLLVRAIGPEVEIAMTVAPDLPHADVDLNQFEMALLNLAVNARDAMDGAGQLQIDVDAVEGDGVAELKPGTYLRVAVTDDGCGMDAATLAQATEPFFTTKGVGKGTGLGLSMIHGLAKQSGGTFTLSSEVGGGTTALLYLPAATAETQLVTEVSAPAPAPAPTASERRTLVILAVDDDVLVSMGTVGLLEDLGHEVIAAYSGAEGLARLAERADIDLILTDQAMPKMTGVEMACQIRLTRPDIPIILATGYADMPDGAAGLITERLEKPFSDAALERLLDRFMV